MLGFLEPIIEFCLSYSSVVLIGTYGSGGCYGFGYSCNGGVICQISQSFCAPGKFLLNNLFVEKDFYSIWNNMICNFFSKLLFTGTNGKGGCYGFGYQCSGGLICKTSDSVCPKGEALIRT